MNKIAIFASGSGSNAENIVKYFNKHQKDVDFLFLTNNSKAFVNERAQKLGIDIINFTKEEFTKTSNIVNILQEFDCDLIVLAGFLWLIPDNLVSTYKNKIINIHPALLPKYGGKGMYGAKIHEAVYNNKESETGITIHYVDSNYDEGKIISQISVGIDKNDTPANIEAKIHELEYLHYPMVIEKLLTERN